MTVAFHMEEFGKMLSLLQSDAYGGHPKIVHERLQDKNKIPRMTKRLTLNSVGFTLIGLK